MNSLFFKNSSIFWNMIPAKIYFSMDNSKINNDNFAHDF